MWLVCKSNSKYLSIFRNTTNCDAEPFRRTIFFPWFLSSHNLQWLGFIQRKYVLCRVCTRNNERNNMRLKYELNECHYKRWDHRLSTSIATKCKFNTLKNTLNSNDFPSDGRFALKLLSALEQIGLISLKHRPKTLPYAITFYLWKNSD